MIFNENKGNNSPPMFSVSFSEVYDNQPFNSGGETLHGSGYHSSIDSETVDTIQVRPV